MSQRKLNVLFSGEKSQEGFIQYMKDQGHNVYVATGPEYQEKMEEAEITYRAQLTAKFPAWQDAMLSGLLKRRFVFSGHDITKESCQSYVRCVLPPLYGFHVIRRGFIEFCRALDIEILVVHNEEAANLRLLLAVAKANGVATLYLIHGCNPRTLDTYAWHDRIRSDKVAVASSLTADLIFLSKPYNRPEQVAVVGRPEWDEWVHKEHPTVSDCLSELGLDSTRPTLGIVGSWAERQPGDPEARLIQAVYRVFSAVKSMGDDAPMLLVRPHPGYAYAGNMGPGVYQAIAERLGIEIFMPTCDLETFVCASTAVLSFQSTVNACALQAGRRCITVEPFQSDPLASPIIWGELEGIQYCVNDLEDIKDALHAVFVDEARGKRLDDFRLKALELINFGNDGQASGRVEQLMQTLVAAKQGLRKKRQASVSSLDGLDRGDTLPAVFSPTSPSLFLETDATHRWLFIPDWSKDGSKDVIQDYLAHFRADDSVALIVRIEPLLPEMVELAIAVMKALIASSGLSDNEVPDLVVEATPLQTHERPGLYTACTTFVASEGLLNNRYIDEARSCGLPVIDANSGLLRSHLRKPEQRPASSRGQDIPKVLVSNRDLALASYGARPASKGHRLMLVG
jgi:hypothetical protein